MTFIVTLTIQDVKGDMNGIWMTKHVSFALLEHTVILKIHMFVFGADSVIPRTKLEPLADQMATHVRLAKSLDVLAQIRNLNVFGSAENCSNLEVVGLCVFGVFHFCCKSLTMICCNGDHLKWPKIFKLKFNPNLWVVGSLYLMVNQWQRLFSFLVIGDTWMANA